MALRTDVGSERDGKCLFLFALLGMLVGMRIACLAAMRWKYTTFVFVIGALACGCGDSDSAKPDSGIDDPVDARPDGNPGAGPDAGMSPDGGPDVLPDPCEGQMPACPTAPGDLSEGGGLVAIDRCAFPLEPRDTWATRGDIIDDLTTSLDQVDLVDVLGDLNRVAVPVSPSSVPGSVSGVEQAFLWNSGDEGVAYWIPQGITGSGAGLEGGRLEGKHVLMVSWYYNRDNDPGSAAQKGVRIAVVDATYADDVRYRFVLLAEPKVIDGRPSFVSVPIHAGGIAWVGRYLYVADTGVGFRVFDLERILKVSTGTDVMGYDGASGNYYAHNYAYILPQVETIADASSCSPRFSFVALDGTTSPPSLVSGEYDSGSITGRLYRWPLDPATDRLQLVGAGRVIAGGAWFSGHSHIQGALAHDGQMWLSSSKPAAGAGILYRTSEGTPTENIGWNDSPEDMSFDPVEESVWSLSEAEDARYVFSVPLTAIE